MLVLCSDERMLVRARSFEFAAGLVGGGAQAVMWGMRLVFRKTTVELLVNW